MERIDQFATEAQIMPRLATLAAEVRALGDWSRGYVAASHVARRHDGAGRPVMVLPGFLSSDGATRTLRRTLTSAGYRAYGWGQGRNYGAKADIMDRLDARLDGIARKAPGPVTLIGWSLGGLFAREYAKHRPERIAKVVTMGSPFSGDPRANHAWRLYELIARHPVDAPPIAVNLAEKPPVPTISLWSRLDGIVGPVAARGSIGEVDHAIEVACRHLGFTSAPDALEAVFAALER